MVSPLPVHAMFFHNFQIQYGMTKKTGERGGKINKGALGFSQSLPACCYFKILSLCCEFCCLWQICRLSKTTTPFQISLGEMVNILVFAWKCQVRWLFHCLSDRLRHTSELQSQKINSRNNNNRKSNQVTYET